MHDNHIPALGTPGPPPELNAPGAAREPGHPASEPSTPSSKSNTVVIEIPAHAACDAQLVTALARLVNDAYTSAEASIYTTAFSRTSAPEIQALLNAGELAVAFPAPPSILGTSPSPPTSTTTTATSRGDPIGCVHVKQLSPTTGTFGMLAVSPSSRAAGLGGALVRFAEARCRDALGLRVVRLDLLFPMRDDVAQQAGKARLQAWYARLGYRPAGLGDFARDHPRLHALLAGPTEYRVFEKDLACVRG
ncbi:hypothetical protein F4825DRAFT_448990 [Nemania diffusa]|nr:hypothetical protein F4825DRAFT_448990 [Nemania diffusa]